MSGVGRVTDAVGTEETSLLTETPPSTVDKKFKPGTTLLRLLSCDNNYVAEPRAVSGKGSESAPATFCTSTSITWRGRVLDHLCPAPPEKTYICTHERAR